MRGSGEDEDKKKISQKCASTGGKGKESSKQKTTPGGGGGVWDPVFGSETRVNAPLRVRACVRARAREGCWYRSLRSGSSKPGPSKNSPGLYLARPGYFDPLGDAVPDCTDARQLVRVDGCTVTSRGREPPRSSLFCRYRRWC